MTKTDQTIRTILGPSLSKRVFAKMAKERKRRQNQEAIEEIERVNDGYFVRPETAEHVDDRLPPDGPEQLRLKFDTE